MQMEWTGAMRDASKQRHVISMEFLQPYMSAGGAVCSQYMTCLACMTDTACGWCVGRCIDRLSRLVARCGDDGAAFVVNSQYCSVCADHVSCTDCLLVCPSVSVSLCLSVLCRLIHTHLHTLLCVYSVSRYITVQALSLLLSAKKYVPLFLNTHTRY